MDVIYLKIKIKHDINKYKVKLKYETQYENRNGKHN